MSGLFGIGGNLGPQLISKSSAVIYAIQLCISYDEKSKTCSIDTMKAQQIFNFIAQNVNLPDVAKDAYAEAMEDLKPYIERLLKGYEAKLDSTQP